MAGSSSAPIVDRLRIIPRADDFLDRNVGSSGEVFFSRDTNTLRVYSGKDVSGFEMARADLNNVDLTSFLQTSTLATTSVSALSDVNYVSTPTVGQILSWDDTYQAFIPTDADLSGGNSSIDVSETAPTTPASGNLWLNTATGKLYIYIDDGTSTQWIEPATTGGGGSSNATTLAGQSASYYLDYNNITNTPTIPTDINSLSNVTATGPSDGQILKWSTSNSAWELASDLVGGAGGVQLSDFSITANAVGTAALSYDNTTGVFTYTPPDLSSYLTSYSETSGLNDVVSRGSTTAQAVTINNTLTVGNVVTNGSGTPEIVSTSTITLEAPDGVIMTDGSSSVKVDDGSVFLGATLSTSPAISNVDGINLDKNGTGQFSRNTSTFADAVIYTNKNGNVGEHIQIRRPGFGGPQRVGAIGESATGNQLGIFNQTSAEVAKTGALGIVFSSYTTTARNALTATTGEVIYNTTSNTLQVYTGSAWADLN